MEKIKLLFSEFMSLKVFLYYGMRLLFNLRYFACVNDGSAINNKIFLIHQHLSGS